MAFFSLADRGAGTIEIAVAVVIDSCGRMLAVRKRGTRHFIQPGGKIDEGETASAALTRELHEEIGWTVDEMALAKLGHTLAEASNEPGMVIRATLFALDEGQPLHPSAEIEQAMWLTRSDSDRKDLSTLTRRLLMAYAPSQSAVA